MNTLYNYNRENLIESDITMKVHRHILSIASPDEAKSIDLRKVFSDLWVSCYCGYIYWKRNKTIRMER